MVYTFNSVCQQNCRIQLHDFIDFLRQIEFEIREDQLFKLMVNAGVPENLTDINEFVDFKVLKSPCMFVFMPDDATQVEVMDNTIDFVPLGNLIRIMKVLLKNTEFSASAQMERFLTILIALEMHVDCDLLQLAGLPELIYEFATRSDFNFRGWWVSYKNSFADIMESNSLVKLLESIASAGSASAFEVISPMAESILETGLLTEENILEVFCDILSTSPLFKPHSPSFELTFLKLRVLGLLITPKIVEKSKVV
jgi:hypothetical protein